AGLDQIVAEPPEHVGLDLAGGVDGRNQIGKHAVEISHVCDCFHFARVGLLQRRLSFCSPIQASTAGSARFLRSAEIAMVSSARAVITRPPDVACAGAKRASSAAWASSLKLVMKLGMN